MFTLEVDDRIYLGILEPHHADELYHLIDLNRVRLAQWLPWVDATQSPEDSEAFIRDSLEKLAKDVSVVAGIRVSGRIAGVIGLDAIDSVNRFCAIGYWIGEEWEGHGVVTKSCARLLDYGFNDRGLHRIEILCDPENQRSRAIPERLGFRNEGTLRERQRIDEQFTDLVMYSILEHEWKAEP